MILELFNVVIEEIYSEMEFNMKADKAIIDWYWDEILYYRKELRQIDFKSGFVGAGIGAGCILLLWMALDLSGRN
jgi:hypothetical protein